MKRNFGSRALEIRGNVDNVSPTLVEGWIAEFIDETPAGGREVSLVVDGHVLETVLADVKRPDLSREFSGDERCGFLIPLSEATRQRFGGRPFGVVDSETGYSLPMPDLVLPSHERLLLDIGDTLIYFSHHPTASGIQRVVTELSRVLHRKRSSSFQLVAGHPDGSGFREVPWRKWESLLDALVANPEDVRGIACELMEYAFDRSRRRVSPRAATLLALGSPWISSEYVSSMLEFRSRGARILGLVYDLIPVRAPEAFDYGTKQRFERVLYAFALGCDHVAAISEYSRQDFERFCRENGITPPPTSAIRLASGLMSIGIPDEAPPWGEYVPLVSTIEGRKGHRLALDVWRRLVDELGPERVPQLVFVGRPGWRSRELFEDLAAAVYLNGKVSVLTKLDDPGLASLYRNALFTIYPSTYEGWGLPVGESVATGTPVIASDATSIPEVAGDYVRYFPSGDRDAFYTAVKCWIDDRNELARWKERIRGYQPDTWEAVCGRLLSEVDRLTGTGRPVNAPDLPTALEAQFTLIHHSEVSDDFVSVSWHQEFLNATPILGQNASSSREVLGALCIRGEGALIPQRGRLLRLGESASIRFQTSVDIFDLYLAVEVATSEAQQVEVATSEAQQTDGSVGVVLLRVDGDVTPVNAWVEGKHVVKAHCRSKAAQTTAITVEVLSGPQTSASVVGVVLRSMVALSEDDTQSRWRIVERSVGVV
ncbi:MAG TPA: hypothetical protein DCQ36_03400 [Actinobacteria bacterium]|nr:hypothetical protein [Actinomycetota bacterium]